MDKLTGMFAAGVFAAFLLMSAAQASAPDESPAHVPATLLESFPDLPDLSLDKGLHIYALDAGPARVLQVNDSKGTVLGAYLTSGHDAEPLPLGQKPQIMTVLAPSANGISVFDVGPEPVPCPCRSSLAYQDGQTRIVAVFGKDDMPVRLVQMSHQAPQD